MEYLAKRFDERTDPATYLPGARSVICVAMNYHVPLEQAPADAGKIARYALGDDYHELIKPRLHQLADLIRQLAPDAQTKCGVDTAPIMEKELAASAGVGWLGKNTCIINEQIGSWLFLGEVITTLDLPFDEPAIDRCGTCRRCIDACPTGAITEPYKLDARKCISYLTIEHRGEIDRTIARTNRRLAIRLRYLSGCLPLEWPSAVLDGACTTTSLSVWVARYKRDQKLEAGGLFSEIERQRHETREAAGTSAQCEYCCEQRRPF